MGKESYSGYCHEMACRLIVGTYCGLKCDKGTRKRVPQRKYGICKMSFLFWEIEKKENIQRMVYFKVKGISLSGHFLDMRQT